MRRILLISALCLITLFVAYYSYYRYLSAVIAPIGSQGPVSTLSDRSFAATDEALAATCAKSAGQSLIISELVAKSDIANYLDGDDWLELQNAGANTLNLRDYTIAVDDSAPVSLPAMNLRPCQFIVIRASLQASADGGWQLPFAFKKAGTVSLYSAKQEIDRLSWRAGEAAKGRSVGRLDGKIQTLYPTPNLDNVPYILFSDNKVFTVKIDMSYEHWKHLLRNAVNEYWYPAELTFNGALVKDVYVRTKGSSSLRAVASLDEYNPSYGRFSFKVKFNKDIDQKFMGMKRLVFNNGYGDPTLMRDLFSYRLMREVGAPASEVSFVDLWVRDIHLGLYQMIEPVDGEYVEKYFPDDKKNDLKGDLYKAFSSLEWQPGMTYTHYTRGRFPELELKTNRHADRTEYPVMSFLKSINSGSAEMIDVDTMARYVAAMTLISNYDSYFGNLGNYYLYEHKSIGAYTMLPWDFNLGLGRSTKTGKKCEDPVVFIDHPTVVPIAERPILARLFEQDEFRKAYHEHLKTLLDKIYNPTDSRAFLQQKIDLIEPYVKRDRSSFYSYKSWKKSFTERVSGEDYFGPAGPLFPFIDIRYEHVKRQLDGEIPSSSPHGGSCSVNMSSQ